MGDFIGLLTCKVFITKMLICLIQHLLCIFLAGFNAKSGGLPLIAGKYLAVFCEFVYSLKLYEDEGYKT